MVRIVAFMFFIVLGMVVGCSNSSKSAMGGPAKSDVLNVAAAPAPAPIPAAAPQPVYDAQPVSYSSAAPMPGSTAVASTGGSKSYTVKKGDTLFSIAKASYGSGRDWQKIVSANPGLDPQKLKVGQHINIP